VPKAANVGKDGFKMRKSKLPTGTWEKIESKL
jgi:hypothetical protein